MLTTYLENRLFQIKLEREESQKKTKTLQDSLRAYVTERGTIAVKGEQTGAERAPGSRPSGGAETTALIPQFGESFLDRLVALSTYNSDVQYRQALTDRIIAEGIGSATLDKETVYYQDLLASVRDLKPAAGNQSLEAKERAIQIIKARLEESLQGIFKAFDQINAIYQELSAQNLNPRTMLYTITQPFSPRTERTLPLRSVALYAFLTLAATLFLVSIGCLTHRHFLSHRVPSTAQLPS